jgi:hypothetical protein
VSQLVARRLFEVSRGSDDVRVGRRVLTAGLLACYIRAWREVDPYAMRSSGAG